MAARIVEPVDHHLQRPAPPRGRRNRSTRSAGLALPAAEKGFRGYNARAMFEVCVTGHFVATHQLRRPDGSTEELHEHDWHVRVTYAGARLDETGVLVDFVAVRGRLHALLAEFHEQNLNHLRPFARDNPTAENVARHLAAGLPQELPGAARLTCVEVEEETGCFGRYYPPPQSPPAHPCG